jgi:hypothetical protein
MAKLAIHQIKVAIAIGRILAILNRWSPASKNWACCQLRCLPKGDENNPPFSGLLPLAAQKRLRRRWLRGPTVVPAKEPLLNLDRDSMQPLLGSVRPLLVVLGVADLPTVSAPSSPF